MDIQNNSFLSIEQLTDRYISNGKKPQPVDVKETVSFQEILYQKSIGDVNSWQQLKFSKHAQERLHNRKISLSENQMTRLQDGARKAEQKGIRDSLVIVDELAFIVNVPNRTVVTAMDSRQTDENVFTNINGAVII